jgi:hypothetical protein
VTTKAMLEIVTGDRRSKHVGYSTTSPCKICACAVSSVSKDPCTLPAILETFVGTLFLLLHFSASIEVKHRTKPLEGCAPEGCSFETYFKYRSWNTVDPQRAFWTCVRDKREQSCKNVRAEFMLTDDLAPAVAQNAELKVGIPTDG